MLGVLDEVILYTLPTEYHGKKLRNYRTLSPILSSPRLLARVYNMASAFVIRSLLSRGTLLAAATGRYLANDDLSPEKWTHVGCQQGRRKCIQECNTQM